MENQLIVLPNELAEMAKNVSEQKRDEVQNVLNKVFAGVSKMREQLDSIIVVDENDKVNMKLSNTIRLGVREVRLDSEKTFDAKRAKVQQQMISFKTEDALWLKSKQVMQILTKEIEENARWKEETAKRFEAEKAELKVQERILIIAKLNPDIPRYDFEFVSDDVFNVIVTGLETAKIDKEESERKAEEERIAVLKAEAEAKAAMEAENKRLKDLAVAKEKQIQAERAKAESERLAFELKAKKEKDARDAQLKSEKEANEKLQYQIRAKAEAEAKEKKDAELKLSDEIKAKQEAEDKAAKAPVKDKLNKWVDGFFLESPIGMNENQSVIEILEKFESFKKWAKTKIETV